MELAPNLHRIGNDLVAVHLVAARHGDLVVNAGFAGHLRGLRRELRRLGRSLDEVRALLLTHGDTDHIGFAERLRARSGIPVLVHEADAARARGEERSSPGWGRSRPAPTAQFLAYAAGMGGLRTRPLREVVTFRDGDVLDAPGHPEVIGLPGHSPGSVAFHLPTVRALFVGDALTTRHVLTGARGVLPAPFTDDPQQAVASLSRLAEAGLDVDWIIPGHGAPFRGGVTELLREYRRVQDAA